MNKKQLQLSIKKHGLRNGVSDRKKRVLTNEEQNTFVSMVNALPTKLNKKD